MSQKNDNARQVKKAEIVFGVIFPADHDASKFIEPGEESLHFPPLLIAKHPAILPRIFAAATTPVGCDNPTTQVPY
jgi:hypothetical protein